MYENLTRLDLVGPALARALGDPGWERLAASLVSGGKSNLTFELTSAAGEAVLRRPPDSRCCHGRTTGFPPRSYLAERYARRTGADLADLPAWVALAHFKCAVIAQGIAARVQAGSMAGQEFGDISGEVDRIAADGLALLTEGSRPDRP